MKKQYSIPSAELMLLPREDICITSGGNGSDPSVNVNFYSMLGLDIDVG